MEIWNQASLPTVQYKTITDKIQSYHANYLKLAYSESRYKSYKAKVHTFKVIFSLTIYFDYFSSKIGIIKVFSIQFRKMPQNYSTFVHVNVSTSPHAVVRNQKLCRQSKEISSAINEMPGKCESAK